jgi:hypothetical protein
VGVVRGVETVVWGCEVCALKAYFDLGCIWIRIEGRSNAGERCCALALFWEDGWDGRK